MLNPRGRRAALRRGFSARRSILHADYLAREDPANWYLWIGLLLLTMVFLARGALDGVVSVLAQRANGEGGAGDGPWGVGRGLRSSFGSLEVIRGVSFLAEGARACALIGPMAPGRLPLINLISGRLTPSAGDSSRAATVTAWTRRAGEGRHRAAFQITSLFRRLTVEENVAWRCRAHDTRPAVCGPTAACASARTRAYPRS